MDVPGALGKLRSLRPDLILLDYGIPSPGEGENFLRAFDVERLLAVIEEVVGPPGETEHERRVTRPRAPSVTRSATTSDPE